MLLLRWFKGRDPVDGRWCPGCGGGLAYKRSKVGQGLATFLWCWSCGWRRMVHVEPEFKDRANENTSPGNGRKRSAPWR